MNSNEKIYLIKIVFDIDPQKKLEQKLMKINSDLNNFVYTTSHDLKGPINNIASLIESFYQHPDIHEKYSEEIDLLKQSINIFKKMLIDLSQVGKEIDNNIENITEIKFQDIFEEVKLNLNKEIQLSQATIIDNFTKAPFLNYSSKNLRSILLNLLSNAIKFRMSNISPKIVITSETIDKEWIVLKVTDNGIGIKAEDKKNVFSMYKRLHNQVEGTGVGMAIVSRIVDNSGGKIEIDSEIGRGTTFKIYFKKEVSSNF
jgi:two-component system, sensor histidine kinase and response regulator